MKAVLFDCDGLMFDTEAEAQRIWKRIAAENGVDLPDDFKYHITGTAKRDYEWIDTVRGLRELVPVISKKRFDLDYWRSFEKDSLNKKGLKELFAWLEENGYQTAVCSSSRSEYVRTLLSTVEGGLPVKAVAGGDHVTRSKPDPQIFLLGAEMLGVKPADCLVLEDSKFGIMAAAAAGMRSVFIEDTIEPDEEMESLIDLRADDLSQVITILKEMEEAQ